MPPDILDALESIVEIFCSAIRHKERAAYVLCDNLVEVACKAKAREHNHRTNLEVGFHAVLTLPGVVLDAALQGRLQGYRNNRNNIQHVGAGLTVDAQHCADAIMDAVDTLNQLWPGTPVHQSRALFAISLRIVKLYSTTGDLPLRADFEDAMTSYRWRTAESEQVQASAIQIKPGRRENWGHALSRLRADVQRILDESGVPPL
ncbi:hypothetical protein [Hymenobacter rigui]|uniref:Uncharacterized protein n=1 Tax=Hymenobacter rigui TaxID=334424 RepID=A0A428KSC7_9BACT|nr:hypothetical protein [Hymenobacter rigui]RSK49394.1 hypothetical protein EI291_07840 [Hymenobacter rigui]